MKHRSYSLDFRLTVIEFAIANSINAASKKYELDRKTVREWKKNKNQIELEIGAGKKKLKRLSGGGRKIYSFEMENDLVNWVDDLRQDDLHVSRSSILKKARDEFHSYDEMEGKNFKASRGWLHRFMDRNNLSLRRRTTLAQKDPADLLPKIVSFIVFVSRMRQKYSIGPESICAMDETSVYFDMPTTTTVTQKGSKSVVIKSTGHEKSHVTVCLAAYGDGRKLKPFIVFRDGIREITKMTKEKEFEGAEIRVQQAGWMDTPLTLEWLDKIFKKSQTFDTRLLVWDSFKCHFLPQTINHLSDFNTKMAVIPGGLTKYIQAPDVSWNRPFKTEVKKHYDEWMSDENNMSFTPAGNLRAPPRREVVTWILKAWRKISQQTIIDSFKSCALTIDPSGQEDHLIHCLKFGERCRGAWDLLQAYRDGDQNVITEIDGENSEEPRVQVEEEEPETNDVILAREINANRRMSNDQVSDADDDCSLQLYEINEENSDQPDSPESIQIERVVDFELDPASFYNDDAESQNYEQMLIVDEAELENSGRLA